MKYLAYFIIFSTLSFNFSFAQNPVNISEGFESSWVPSGWSQTDFTRVNSPNHTSGGTFSASHNTILTGSGNITTQTFSVLNGEFFDTISVWVYKNAIGISGNISFDITGSVTSSNLATVNLTAITANTWTKFSYSYNVTQADDIALSITISNGLTIGSVDLDDIRINKLITLPVQMAYFNSNVNKNNAALNWSTAWEINNNGFEVERAPVTGSSVLWSAVSFINGSGTTTQQKHYSFTDNNLNSGSYLYRLKQIDYNGNFEYFQLSNPVIIGRPDDFNMSQNYPNPSNPSSKINYQIPSAANVSIKIYDLTGREVMTLVNEFKDAGYYNVIFNGNNLSSGVYLYRLSSGAFTDIKKLILVK